MEDLKTKNNKLEQVIAWRVTEDGLLKRIGEYDNIKEFIECNEYESQEYLDRLIISPALKSINEYDS